MVNAMIMYKKQLCCLGISGLPIQNEKSVLIPSQVLTFLGFVLNSVTMIVQLTESLKKKLKNARLNLVNGRNLHSSKCNRVNWADSVKFSMGGTWPPPLSQPWKGTNQMLCEGTKANFGSFMILFPSSRAKLVDI